MTLSRCVCRQTTGKSCVQSFAFVFFAGGKSATNVSFRPVLSQHTGNTAVQFSVQKRQSFAQIFVSGGFAHAKGFARFPYGAFSFHNKVGNFQNSFTYVTFQFATPTFFVHFIVEYCKKLLPRKIWKTIIVPCVKNKGVRLGNGSFTPQ